MAVAERRHPVIPQGMTRRRLLQVGGIGLLGLSLPQFLRASAAKTGPSPRRVSDRSCIFIVQYGGCSHIDSLDPKPDAPEGIRGLSRKVSLPKRPIAYDRSRLCT